LSPIGLHVRTGPSRSAKVIGSAGQGAVLQTAGLHQPARCWYKVLGTTLTGWISADPAYSTRGQFFLFQLARLRRAVTRRAGRQAGRPRTGVTFRSPSPTEKVIIQTAPSLAQTAGRRPGRRVSQSSSRIFVACGVTGYFVTYTTSTPRRYLAGIVSSSTRNPRSRPSERRTPLRPSCGRSSTSSTRLSFPFAVCIGGAPTTTVAHTKAFHHDDSGRQQDRPKKHWSGAALVLPCAPSRGAPSAGVARAVGTAQLGL